MTDYENYEQRIEEYLSKREYSAHTVEAYQMWIGRLADYFAPIPPEDISLEQIEEYLWFLYNRKRLAGQTVHQAAHALHTIYNNVFGKPYDVTSLPLPKRGTQVPEIFSPSEVIDLLNNTEDLKQRLVFATIYSAGLSTTEIRNLRLIDVDFRNKWLSIMQPRGKRSRRAILSEYLASELKPYIKQYKPEKWLFEGKTPGCQYSASAIQRAFKRALCKAGIDKPLAPKSLKYSYVKHLEAQGIPLRNILQDLDMASSYHSRTFGFYSKIGERDVEVTHSPLDFLIYDDASSIDTATLERALLRVQNRDERDYLLEAVQCLKSGVYRATVIFAWTAAMTNIHHKCLQHSQHSLNVAIKKHYPGAPTVKKVDDFAYIKDRTVLEASKDIGLFDKDEKETLVDCLNLRNKCAHPGKYRPKPLKAAAFLEDLVSIVFGKV